MDKKSDHPRSRGVYALRVSVTSRLSGSSPLARGLHLQVIRRHDGDGIIPARAGFTFRPLLRRARTQDHPRSRGVYMQMYEEAANVEGSSPLARGLH